MKKGKLISALLAVVMLLALIPMALLPPGLVK